MANLTVLALIKAKPGKEEALKQELLALIEPTQAEPGYIEYRMHQSLDDKACFMFYEHWASKDALNEHIQTPHLQALLAKADDLFAEPLDVRFWEEAG